MQNIVKITRALSDENRVRILMLLRETELCVCQIIGMLDLAPSTISKHITILMQAGLIETRKEGRWHYFRLPGRNAPPAVSQATRWVFAALDESPKIAEDRKRLASLLKRDVKELCDLYKR